MGWEGTLSTQPYGDRFRKQRRLLNEYMNPQVLRRYYPLQELSTARLVRDVIKSPDALNAHVKRCASRSSAENKLEPLTTGSPLQ
jgi:cytochrome P450